MHNNLTHKRPQITTCRHLSTTNQPEPLQPTKTSTGARDEVKIVVPPPHQPPIQPPAPEFTTPISPPPRPDPTPQALPPVNQFRPISAQKAMEIAMKNPLSQSPDPNVKVVGEVSNFLLKNEWGITLFGVFGVAALGVKTFYDIQGEWERGEAVF